MEKDFIYQSKKAPPEFIRCFIWWACRQCPNQKYETLKCGHKSPMFTESNVSKSALEKMTADCDAFWHLSKSVIETAKGRCKWHPQVDTDEHHVGECGGNFFFSRNEDYFFMSDWPTYEKNEFCKHAKKFYPMFLKESNGKLNLCQDSPFKPS